MEAWAWAAIGVVGGTVTCSIIFATFWMNMQKQITEAKGAADSAKAEAESAGLRAVQANLKIDTTQTSLSEFKVYAEREFVNHDDLKALVVRHEAQFDNLREDLKGITSRLDRLLEGRIQPSRS